MAELKDAGIPHVLVSKNIEKVILPPHEASKPDAPKGIYGFTKEQRQHIGKGWLKAHGELSPYGEDLNQEKSINTSREDWKQELKPLQDKLKKSPGEKQQVQVTSKELSTIEKFFITVTEKLLRDEELNEFIAKMKKVPPGRLPFVEIPEHLKAKYDQYNRFQTTIKHFHPQGGKAEVGINHEQAKYLDKVIDEAYLLISGDNINPETGGVKSTIPYGPYEKDAYHTEILANEGNYWKKELKPFEDKIREGLNNKSSVKFNSQELQLLYSFSNEAKSKLLLKPDFKDFMDKRSPSDQIPQEFQSDWELFNSVDRYLKFPTPSDNRLILEMNPEQIKDLHQTIQKFYELFPNLEDSEVRKRDKLEMAMRNPSLYFDEEIRRQADQRAEAYNRQVLDYEGKLLTPMERLNEEGKIWSEKETYKEAWEYQLEPIKAKIHEGISRNNSVMFDSADLKRMNNFANAAKNRLLLIPGFKDLVENTSLQTPTSQIPAAYKRYWYLFIALDRYVKLSTPSTGFKVNIPFKMPFEQLQYLDETIDESFNLFPSQFSK